MKLFYTILFITAAEIVMAQGGYVLDPVSLTWPDTTITLETTSIRLYVNREDVKAVGMGKTQVANGKTFNAMTYNPALLSRKRFSIDGLAAGLSLPPKTYEAANYLNDHRSDFREAVSLRELWQEINDFNQATTLQEQVAALKRMQQGLKFPRDLFKNVIGSAENPTTHGIRATPALQFQYDNFGVSLYGIGQSAFEVEQSPLMDALLDIPLPEDLNDPQQVAQAIVLMQGLLLPFLELNNFDDALPVAYSVAYMDLVGSAGYAYNFTPEFAVGASLKVVHRRFSVRRFLIEDYNNIINLFKQDFNRSITGVTADIGFLYTFPSKTEIGLTIQNLIPIQGIKSTLNVDFDQTFLTYKTDQFGQIEVTPQGDTVIQSNSLKIHVGAPFELELPMIVNFGAVHAITPDWDVAFDWADITEQDIRFIDYTERFRVGTEYRLSTGKDQFGIAFRLGMADNRFTGGLGLDIFRVFQIDGAYAWDNYVDAYSYYAQIKVGW